MTKKTKGLTLAEAMKVAKTTTKAELEAAHGTPLGEAVDRAYGAPPKRGRPPMGEPVEAVVGKTVKHTPAFWAELEKTAAREGISVHEAMRQALVQWVARRAS